MTGTTKSKQIGRFMATALTLAAGGLVGCADGADEETGAAAEARQWDFGIPAVYGDLPAKGPEEQDTPRQLSFNPKYYAVVYLKLENGTLAARHAYFEIKTEDDDIDCAIGYLRSHGSDTNQIDPNCPAYTDSDSPAGNQKRPKPISAGFDNFGFGSQQRVYVFVDNDSVAFNQPAISFTPFGAFDSPQPRSKPTRHENLSFYNAEVRALGSPARNALLYIENFYRGMDGSELPDQYDGDQNSKYSLNFNLLVCRDGRTTCDFTDKDQVIPIAIDPDTGNGWGSKP